MVGMTGGLAEIQATFSLFWTSESPMKKTADEYSAKEVKARFEAALKGALNTPHKPLKEKPKAKKAAKKSKGKQKPA
jgi:hypothetical protein